MGTFFVTVSGATVRGAYLFAFVKVLAILGQDCQEMPLAAGESFVSAVVS
jgi:hypothetical protein